MTSFHINAKGEPGQCRAQKQCPFGGVDAHFTSAEAARSAYEAQQSGVFKKPQTPKEKFPFMIANVGHPKHISASGKFADGSFPRIHVENKPEGFALYGSRKELLRYSEENGLTNVPEDALAVNPQYVRVTTPVGPVSKAPVKRATASKVKSTPAPKTVQEFDKAILDSVPEVADAKVGGKPQANDDQGYMGGRRFIGAAAGKKDAEGRSVFIGQTAAAAGIRQLVAEAKKAGELPKWVDVSVRKNSGAWVSSISVVVGYKPEGSTKAVEIPKEWITADENGFRRNNREAANRLESYVSHLARQYESSDINSMVDYFNSSNAGRVQWRDSWS